MMGQGFFNSGNAGGGGIMGNMMQGPMMGTDPSMMMMFNQVSELLHKHVLKYLSNVVYEKIVTVILSRQCH